MIIFLLIVWGLCGLLGWYYAIRDFSEMDAFDILMIFVCIFFGIVSLIIFAPLNIKNPFYKK